MSKAAGSDALPRALTQRLIDLVGEDGVITDPSRLFVYESDALTAYRYPPRAVVLPADTEQAAGVLSALAAEGLPFVPRGAGTGLSGGALAIDRAVLVGTSRMNRILALDPAGRLARVQAGVVNSDLTNAARKHGLHYAPDPSSQTACTLGGNIAENAGGPHCLKYGVTSRWVTGLTLVLPDGRVTELGGWGKEIPGLDLVGAVVGSEGCFGLVTEIEVRLLPIPAGVRTSLAIFEDMESAGKAVTDIINSGLLPAALEIIDQEVIKAVEASIFAAGLPTDAGAVLVIEFDGTEAGLDADAERAEACCRGAGAREVRRARDEAEREALWKGRKKAYGAMGRIAPDVLIQDATVPRSKLPAVLHRIVEIGKEHGLRLANSFHAGDGNLHPKILFDRRDAEQVARVELASEEIMKTCVAAGGTITGEHGVGIDKRRYMSLVCSPLELELMGAVKAVFDPDGLCNAGKVLPTQAADSSRRPMNVATVGAAAALREILPRERVIEGDQARRWSAAEGPPPAVAFPTSTDEAAAVLARASAEGWTIAPAGCGSWLWAGGAAPDLVLSTERMTRVVEYEPADLTITVEAGLTLSALSAMITEKRQWLPLDPPGRARTMGAVAATGAWGPLASSWGGPRDLALGLRAVTGDGRAFNAGGRVVKNVAGFDLVRLLVGSKGTLAFLTEVTMRLFPLPEADITLLARAGSLEDLADAAVRAITHPVTPAAVELLERFEPLQGRREGLLGVRLLGGGERVAAEAELLRAALAGSAELETLPAAAAEAFWREVQELEEDVDLAVRLTHAPARMGEMIGLAREVGRMRDGHDELARSPVRIAAHAGSGALRLAVPRVRLESGWDERWAERLDDLRRTLSWRGGTLTLSRAPGALLAQLRGTGAETVQGELTRGLKTVFDPAGILSVDRFLLGVGPEARG